MSVRSDPNTVHVRNIRACIVRSNRALELTVR